MSSIRRDRPTGFHRKAHATDTAGSVVPSAYVSGRLLPVYNHFTGLGEIRRTYLIKVYTTSHRRGVDLNRIVASR